MTSEPFHVRMCREPACTLTTKLISYEGQTLFAFFDAAKEALGRADAGNVGQKAHTVQKSRTAIRELTRTDLRESSEPHTAASRCSSSSRKLDRSYRLAACRTDAHLGLDFDE